MESDIIDKVPDDFKIPPFEDNEEGKMAQYGYNLITKTYTLIGPNTKNRFQLIIFLALIVI